MTIETENDKLYPEVQAAIAAYKARCYVVYRKYTKRYVLNRYDCFIGEYPLDQYKQNLVQIKARMSQGKGAASKRAKGLLIIETMNVISQLDLNLSWYEAYQMLKHGAGRVVNKRMLTGYFDRDRSELYYSPFKNEAHQYDEYRENLLSHPAILRLRNWCDSYDLYKPYVGNPHQEIVDWAKKRYSLGHGL